MSSPKPTKGSPVSRTQAARAGGSSSLPLFAIGIALLVVVALGAVVVMALSGDDGEESVDTGAAATSPAQGDQAYGPIEIEGEVLPPLVDGGGDDAALGSPAPTLTGETPGGEPLTIDPSSEGPMLIAFVAHWCPHCQAEVPRLVELFEGEAELDGVELIAVSTGADETRGTFPPGEWLAGEGWPGRTMVDDQQQSGFLAYGGGSYPYLVAVDADGTVVARASGEQGEEKLQELVDAAAGTAG